jgi:type IV pilus assembly protein PilA
MKTELKAKFLQHLINKNANKGFTLIELLVVIIIIGILSAIALPSFLNQANKAKQSEAKTYVGSANRAQQAYFLEKNAFAPDLTTLELGISNTPNYSYTIAAGGGTGTAATSTATASPSGVLRGYQGRVWIETTSGATGTATSKAVLCEGAPGAVPTTSNSTSCPSGT